MFTVTQSESEKYEPAHEPFPSLSESSTFDTFTRKQFLLTAVCNVNTIFRAKLHANIAFELSAPLPCTQIFLASQILTGVISDVSHGVTGLKFSGETVRVGEFRGELTGTLTFPRYR